MLKLLDKHVHPSDCDLFAYSVGKLESSKATAIEEHVGQCEMCCKTLLSSSNKDALSGFLRNISAAEFSFAKYKSIRDPSSAPKVLLNHQRYEFAGFIASGGMGSVFRARHRVMERTVAIKVIKPSMIERVEIVSRFHREVKAAASLSHPNIVAAYDAEEIDGVHLLVMESVDGIDLASLVGQSGPLPVPLACEYIRQAASGLDYAHRQGMVHRDIKPRNLMVNQEATVKILDFGLAHLRESAPEFSHASAETSEVDFDVGAGATRFGHLVGTPGYMSPEQCSRGEVVDARSDVYSLGCTFYFLLTGEPPFSRKTPADLLRCHREEAAPSLRLLRDEVPEELDVFVLQMLAKDPEKRPSSCEDVANCLHTFAVRQREKNKRWPLVGVATAMIALLVFGIVFYIEAGRATINFRIAVPNLVVRFAGEEIRGNNDGQRIVVKPNTEQRFIVEQNGKVLEAGTINLAYGQKVAFDVTFANGVVAVVPDEKEVKISRIASPVIEPDESQVLKLLRDAEFVESDGEKIANGLKGKIVGLYFTASWCGPCKLFTPQLQQVRNANSENFDFVVMSLDKDLESQLKYLSSGKIRAHSVKFDDPLTAKLMKKFRFGAIPTLLIFSPRGNLITASGVDQLRTILEKDPEIVTQDPVDNEAIGLWKTIVSNQQEKLKVARETEMSRLAAAQDSVFASYSEFSLVRAIRKLGPVMELEQCNALLSEFGMELATRFGDEEKEQLEKLKRLANDLSQSYAGSASPLYWSGMECIKELGKASVDQPQIYEVFSNWVKIEETETDRVSKSWGYLGIAVCAAAGHQKAISDIKTMSLEQGGGISSVINVFDVLSPMCREGNITAIRLVGDLFGKNHYLAYAALEALEAPAANGQADALQVIRDIANSEAEEEYRKAAEALLRKHQ